MNRLTAKGFTLIELMIIVAIVAILALIAWPSYQTYIHRTRLESARADLLTNSQMIEKRYMKDHSFAGLTTTDLVANKSKDFYDIVFRDPPTTDSYTIIALPTDDSNDYLSYNNQGEMLICNLGTSAPSDKDECKSY